MCRNWRLTSNLGRVLHNSSFSFTEHWTTFLTTSCAFCFLSVLILFFLSVFLLPLLPADLHFSLVSNSVCYAKLIAHLIFSIHELETNNHVQAFAISTLKQRKNIFSFVFMKKITPRTHRQQSKLKREIERKTNMWPGTKSNKQVVNRNRFVSCCSLLFWLYFFVCFTLFSLLRIYMRFSRFILLQIF